MKRLSAVAVLVASMFAACSSAAPSATPAAAFPANLELENRGGPAFNVAINGSVLVTVPCEQGAMLTPGASGAPQLPWDLKIKRVSDGTVLVDLKVTELPRWFTQSGSDAGGGGLSQFAIAGPPGPTCPPSS